MRGLNFIILVFGCVRYGTVRVFLNTEMPIYWYSYKLTV